MAAPNVEFMKGDPIEVSMNEDGFENSWYPATYEARFLKESKYLVSFTTLLQDDGITPLRHQVPIDNVRPVPMSLPVRLYSLGDIVDAYTRDGWWKATVVRMVGQLTEVRFPVATEDDESYYIPENVRVHQRYTSEGEWVFKKKRTRRAYGDVVY